MLEEIKSGISNWLGDGPEGPAFIVAVLVMIATSILSRYLKKKRKRDRLIAIENDHIIIAKLVKKYTDTNEDGRTRYSGKYEYIVNGQIKHKNINSIAYEVKLYYVKSPNKVFSDHDRNYNSGCGCAVVLGMLTFFLTMFLVGRFI